MINPKFYKYSSWLLYFVGIAAVLYFYAPASWWQFGVLDDELRTPAQPFSLKSVEGEPWRFEDQRGKVVLVNYWATWCGPCRFETPGLVGIHDEFSDEAFSIVGVTVDDDISDITDFVKNYGIKYPILRYGRDPNLGAGGMMLPTTFLYDKSGRLAKKYTGIVLESTLRSDIGSLLSEPQKQDVKNVEE